VATGCLEERAVVRHDQTCFAKVTEEVLEQNLRAQIEKVRRFV
jgi:hypothetical protein